MEYLKVYNSLSDYDADYYSGVLPFPHVALVNGEVVYAEAFDPYRVERLPLYISAIEDLTVSFSYNDIQYSLDNSEWVDLPADTATPTILAGNIVYFRCKSPSTTSTEGIGTFTISGRCEVGGNVMSMVYGEYYIGRTGLTQYQFRGLFYNQSTIESAHSLILPTQTLNYDYVYHSMFYGCSALKYAPKLPAVSLSLGCYYMMFYGCSKLASAPDLPAQILPAYCYHKMFAKCASLTETPGMDIILLQTTTVNSTAVSYACSSMFNGCINLVDASAINIIAYNYAYAFEGMFYGCSALLQIPTFNMSTNQNIGSNAMANMFYNCESLTDANITILANYVFSSGMANMFYNCTNLKSAPKIQVLKNFYDRSCSYMFANCISLTETPEMTVYSLSNGYQFDSMFYNCTKLQTCKIDLSLTTITERVCRCMFYGCTSLVTAPELPATRLATSCYEYMFYGCTSLVTAPELPATTLATSCYDYMFYGCTSLVTAPELPATTLATYCYQYMFYNCTNLTYIKAMFTTTPSTSYTANWVSGVASTGTFVKNSAATWGVTGVYGVPSGWTVETADA